MTRPVVYVLHFGRELGTPGSRHGRAGHYVGVALDGNVHRRLAVHLAGHGAAITRACVERGIPMFVSATFPGGRKVERKLKRRKNTPKLCGACVPAPWEVQEAELEQLQDDAAELALERALEDAHFSGVVA